MRVSAIRSTRDRNSFTTTRDGTVLFHIARAAKALVEQAIVLLFFGQRSVSSGRNNTYYTNILILYVPFSLFYPNRTAGV
jgi:hypothetical protein